MRCEVLTDPNMYLYGKTMLSAMVKAAPIPCVERATYNGDRDLLMTYGLGHQVRRPWWFKHLATGRHAIGFDLGYWRTTGEANMAMRLTIDAEHPWRLLRKESPDRFEALGISLRNDYDPAGPILLIGLGAKQNVVMHQAALTWENAEVERIRAVYPNTEIVYRPKREDLPRIPGLRYRTGMGIESAMRGCSLVVCRHSNVAVDACVAGIPVVCSDGIAHAIYNNDLANPRKPTEEERYEFLCTVAHWQWRPSEASDCWKFIFKVLAEEFHVAA